MQNVTCLYCKIKGAKDTYIRLKLADGMNAYCCCKDCLDAINSNRDFYESKYYVIKIVGHITKATDSFIMNQIKGNFTPDEYKILHDVLKKYWQKLATYLDTKDFANKNAKVKYLMMMLIDKVATDKEERKKIERKTQHTLDLHVEDVAMRTTSTTKTTHDISMFLD